MLTKIIGKLSNSYRRYGFYGVIKKIQVKLAPSRFYRNKEIIGFQKFSHLFKNKRGIEIGGPSDIFNVHIPIYDIVSSLDCCNFSNSTVWEGRIIEGKNFKYRNRIGFQFLAEATNINQIGNEEYDFLVTSNCLEHIANPMLAIEEWLRIIKNDGVIMIIVPNKFYCFDHNRPFTSFEHILNDYRSRVDERDLTHLSEIIKLHDLDLDPQAGDYEQFKERSLRNFENRCLHHHVFSTKLLRDLFEHFNLRLLFKSTAENLIVIGKKISSNEK
ncbi:MAG: methyltransferase domain-containing protein [Cyclobacteriaceae bacterium]